MKLWMAEEAEIVLNALDSAGIRAWIVGGSVRDLLRGETPHDWDIAAAALPEETKPRLGTFA